MHNNESTVEVIHISIHLVAYIVPKSEVGQGISTYHCVFVLVRGRILGYRMRS